MKQALEQIPLATSKCAGSTHIGKLRKDNEDSFISNEPLGLYIVADGMGGHEHGKTASLLACKLVEEKITQGESVEAAIHFAHEHLKQLSYELGAMRGMGTTIVVLRILDAKTAGVWWVGDSRLYVSTVDNFSQITIDHSRVQELIDLEIISKQSAKSHPQKNVITRAVGTHSNTKLKIDFLPINISNKCRFLLCTDGLSNELDDAVIQDVLQQSEDLKSVVDSLVAMANLAGGRDNITALVVDVY